MAIGKHELTLFDVDPCASEKLASELGGTKLGGTRVAVAKPPADGVPESDIVILASWFLANVETATQLGAGLQGKAVVEISNPLNRSNDWLATPPELSAAEAVLAVLAASEERKDLAVDLFRKCGGHFINFFGDVWFLEPVASQ